MDDVAGEIEIHESKESSGEEFSSDDEPLVPQRKKAKISSATKWRKTKNRAITTDPLELPEVGSEHIDKTEFEIYSLFLIEEIIKHIKELYASRDKGNHSFTLTDTELRRFLGILIISGYHSLRSETITDQRLQTSVHRFLVILLSREKYRTIKRYLYLAHNQNLAKSEVAKILSFYDKILRQFQQSEY